MLWIKTGTEPAQLINPALVKTITILEKSSSSFQLVACYDDYEIPLKIYNNKKDAEEELNQLYKALAGDYSFEFTCPGGTL